MHYGHIYLCRNSSIFQGQSRITVWSWTDIFVIDSVIMYAKQCLTFKEPVKQQMFPGLEIFKL